MHSRGLSIFCFSRHCVGHLMISVFFLVRNLEFPVSRVPLESRGCSYLPEPSGPPFSPAHNPISFTLILQKRQRKSLFLKHELFFQYFLSILNNLFQYLLFYCLLNYSCVINIVVPFIVAVGIKWINTAVLYFLFLT